jgi:hypothetical protein
MLFPFSLPLIYILAHPLHFPLFAILQRQSLYICFSLSVLPFTACLLYYLSVFLLFLPHICFSLCLPSCLSDSFYLLFFMTVFVSVGILNVEPIISVTLCVSVFYSFPSVFSLYLPVLFFPSVCLSQRLSICVLFSSDFNKNNRTYQIVNRNKKLLQKDI